MEDAGTRRLRDTETGEGRGEIQIPNPKNQIPKKSQLPNPKSEDLQRKTIFDWPVGQDG